MSTQRAATGRSATYPDAANTGLVDGIFSGEIIESAVPAMNVRSLALSVVRSNRVESVPDQTLAIGAAPAVGLVRVDMVQWNGTTLSIKAGTAAAIGSVACPSPDPGFIPLALVWIPESTTTISNMGVFTSLGNILAYYRARTGVFASRMIKTSFGTPAGIFTDPEIALPIYFPRKAVVSLRGIYTTNTPSGSLLSIRVILRLDGVDIPGVDSEQAYNASPAGSVESSNSMTLAQSVPRGGLSAGSHLWNPRIIPRNSGQVLAYRSMELQEIL